MPSYLDTQKHLHQCVYAWFDTPSGRRLLQMERCVLERLSEGLFGYYLVQIQSFGHALDWLDESPVQHKLQLSLNENLISPVSIRACSEMLPLATASTDVVVLPHTLDFALDPHRVLREIERILIPEGRVIILGFNPVSLWGLNRLLLKQVGKSPWRNGHFIPYQRVADWLGVLGFDIELNDVCAFLPPSSHQGRVDKLDGVENFGRRFIPGGTGVYALRAVKRVSTVKPIKMHTRRLRALKSSAPVLGKISSNR